MCRRPYRSVRSVNAVLSQSAQCVRDRFRRLRYREIDRDESADEQRGFPIDQRGEGFVDSIRRQWSYLHRTAFDRSGHGPDVPVATGPTARRAVCTASMSSSMPCRALSMRSSIGVSVERTCRHRHTQAEEPLDDDSRATPGAGRPRSWRWARSILSSAQSAASSRWAVMSRTVATANDRVRNDVQLHVDRERRAVGAATFDVEVLAAHRTRSRRTCEALDVAPMLVGAGGRGSRSRRVGRSTRRR